MPDIEAFDALRFSPAAGALGDLVSPPYDVISPAARAALLDRNSANVVRLILPDGVDEQKYAAARATLDGWVDSGALERDGEPTITVYEQRFRLGDEVRVLRGILAAAPLDEGGVLPHERTYDSIVGDRLDLLRATETNLEPVFLVYEGRSASAHETMDAICATEPRARFTTDDTVEHAVWRIADPDTIAALRAPIDKATVVIADGHHRWRTAQLYRDERRARDGAGPWDSHLALLVDVSRFGPALLPIHRVVPSVDAEHALRALEGAFTIEPAPREDPEGLARALEERRASGARTFVLLDRARAWWLTVADESAERDAMPAERSVAWRDLDVAVLQHLVFERLLGGAEAHFVHSAAEAAEGVEGGGVAFLLAAVPFDAVRAVAEAGEAMPPKSTYFVPKPKTGIVLRAL